MKTWINTSPVILFTTLGMLVGCARHPGPIRPGYDRDMGAYPSETQAREVGYTETGMISYYADKFHGRKTASGERFDKNGFTAAHRSLPFRTRVKVTNLENGKSVVVEVTDRGPYSSNRILDLSPAAARKISLMGTGTAKATVTVE
jgi:rare lipoprotein A